MKPKGEGESAPGGVSMPVPSGWGGVGEVDGVAESSICGQGTRVYKYHSRWRGVVKLGQVDYV